MRLSGAGILGAGAGIGATSWFGANGYPETFLNVKADYGALGDRKTEDTEAFQQAMKDAAGGGKVYVPPGEYPTRRVETFENTIVYGKGKESKLLHAPKNLNENPETYTFDSDEADHIECRKLFFSGNISEHEFTGRPGNANSELLDPVGGSRMSRLSAVLSKKSLLGRLSIWIV